MQSHISQKAKRLTGWMALTTAVAAGAFAIAIVLFFKLWWAGLIALAVSMLCAAATALMFMAYRADRRKAMTMTQEEMEDARIMSLLESRRSESEDRACGERQQTVLKCGEINPAADKENGMTLKENNSADGDENI